MANVTVVIRAQRIEVGKPAMNGGNRLEGRIAATSYLAASAVYLIDYCAGMRLQANNMIEGKSTAEGEDVTSQSPPPTASSSTSKGCGSETEFPLPSP